MPRVDSVGNRSGLLIGKNPDHRNWPNLEVPDTMWYSIVGMWLVRKVPEDSIWKWQEDYLCVSGPRIDADSWFRWKQFRFNDKKKIQIFEIDPIFNFQTLCDIYIMVEMWLVRKVQEDSIWKRWKEYLYVLGPRIDADSWFRWKQFRFVDRKKIQTIGIDPILKFQTLCDIALWKCGLWENFQKIRFGRDRRNIYAFPVRR